MRRLMAAGLGRIMRGRPRVDPRSEAAIAGREFDRAYYLKTYLDVAAVGADPLEHFLAYGWREGRNPNASFSVDSYLAAFPDVAASGVNPFVHYLENGRPEAVPPESPLGFRFDILEHQTPIESRLARLASGVVSVAAEEELSKALAQSRDRLAGLHVTFSHDDFSTNVGGLQFAIRREAARLSELGRDHLHLHSARAWPLVREAVEREPLSVVWNGRSVGAFWPAQIVKVLGEVAEPRATGRSFAIHSLLGHAPDEVVEILAAVGLTRGVFWLHDFASLCAGYHLLRNGVEDCSAPPPDSAACSVCLYGPWRERHTRSHARLFARLDLSVAAPSVAALELWRRSADLPAVATQVLPHAVLNPKGPASVTSAARPFRIAYAGLPVAHKGWPAFTALASAFNNDPRYEFIHLGAERDRAMPFRFIDVRGGPNEPHAMTQALQSVEADAILIWPLCQETFSFVAYEAVAAGCAVITGPDSGNVAAFVAETGHGLVIPDEAGLSLAFQTGEILKLGRAHRRPMLYDLTYSALTLDLATTPTS